MRNRKFHKNKKKIKKYHYGFISSQNRLEKNDKEKKQKFSFCSVLTRRVIENFKKIQKLKNTIMDLFQAKISWKRMRKRKNKNYKIPLWIPFKPK